MPEHELVADPIVWWPGALVRLETLIDELQRLNPTVALRRDIAVGERLTDKEFLVLERAPTEPLHLVLPIPVSDDLLIGLSEHNYEWWPVTLHDHGRRQTGPWRMERAADGDLVVRPNSWLEGGVLSAFSIARSGVHSMVFFTARWGFAPTPPAAEIWEIDSAHASEETWQRIMTRHHETGSETASWRIPPDLAISVFGERDYPRDVHIDRARTLVAAGTAAVAVCDLGAADITIVRSEGDERLERPEHWRLREIPDVEMPFARLLDER